MIDLCLLHLFGLLSLISTCYETIITFTFIQDFDEDSFQLVFGNNENTQHRRIKSVEKHSKYKSGSLRFNIALVKVDPLIYDEEIMPIDLPCANPGR